MSPPERASDQKVTQTPSSDGSPASRPDYDPIKEEAQHSLFMDSFDPRLWPDPKTLGQESIRHDPAAPKQRPDFADTNEAQSRSADSSSASPLKDMTTSDDAAAKDKDITMYNPQGLSANDRSREMLFDKNRANGQALADKAADMIFPGFGRLEGTTANGSWRIDYLTGKSCHGQTLGICFKMKIE